MEWESQESRAPGFDPVLQVREVLSGYGSLHQRLYRAGEMFWSGVILAEYWPINLRSDAELLMFRFIDRGCLSKTIFELDESEAVLLLNDLLAFVERIESDRASCAA